MTFENSIFAVVAEDGSYSDYTTWIAAAYFTKNEAEECAAKLNTEAEGIRQRRKLDWHGWHKVKDEQLALGKTLEQIIEEFPQPVWEPSMADEYGVVEVPIGKLGNYWPR